MQMQRIPTVAAPKELMPSLAGGHAWVYRDQLPRGFSARTGQWVRVQAGRFQGFGLWDEDSPIAVRVYSKSAIPDADWVRDRVARAWDLRAPLRDDGGTNAFRWIFGEGDGLPGIVVDYYAGFAVVTTASASVEPVLSWLFPALLEVAELKGVSLRSERALHLVSGKKPSRNLIVLESGLKLRADLEAGQKTGLFLDHRENREWLRPLCAGKRVLNLYSYTGAFSLAALAGGATHVTSVDASQPALDAARENVRINGWDVEGQAFVKNDVVDFLRAPLEEKAERFDVVVCDPPSFAKNKSQRHKAERAYVKVNELGMRATKPGGLYVAASCTSQVGPEAFRRLLGEAAGKARCRFQITHEAGHALDHPVMAGHLESRYLKFVAGRVLTVD